jgi:hypothetical protein
MTNVRVVHDDAYDFDITSEWDLRAEPEELSEVVLDPDLFHLWCSSTILKAQVLDRGAPDGMGMTLRLHVKGMLPHTFFCLAKVVDLVRHRSMKIAVSGDFEGVGTLSVQPTGTGVCAVTAGWRVRINQPYIRPFIRVLRPVFVFNHVWGVRQISHRMQEEIDRRRNGSDQFAGVKATFPHNLAFFRRGWRRIGSEFHTTPQPDISGRGRV